MFQVSDHGVNLGSFSSMWFHGIVVHQRRLRCMSPESDASTTIGAIASGVVSSRRLSRTAGCGTTFSKTVSMDVLKAFPKLVFDPQHMFEKPTGCTLGALGGAADTGEVRAGWSGCDHLYVLLSLKLCLDVLYDAFDVELGDVSHRHRREFLGHELDTRGIDLLSVAWIIHSTVGSRIRRPWAVLSLFLTSFVRLALRTSSLRSFIAFGVPSISRCYGWSRVERR